MRILVDNGTYRLHNMGDVAMLQVAVGRLREYLPSAAITVVCAVPERLSEYVDAASLDPCGRVEWLSARLFPIRQRWLPGTWRARCLDLEDRLRHRLPKAAALLMKLTAALGCSSVAASTDYLNHLLNYDAVVASGGGYLNDCFPTHTRWVLSLLEIARALRKPVALLGQGIGPLVEPSAVAQARRVLPHIHGIGLRERRCGPRLLESLGVPASLVACTGDDAIELAYRLRSDTVGTRLGVSLRKTTYSAIDLSDTRALGEVLRNWCEARGTQIQPLPISLSESDESAIAELCHGFGIPMIIENTVATPAAVIGAAGRCRLVVTATYHAAVFALSQGIPVVGLAKSKYYEDKLGGLADLFPRGCTVIHTGSLGFQKQLRETMDRLWAGAQDLRPQLLAAAREQIRSGRVFYSQLCESIGSRTPRCP